MRTGPRLRPPKPEPPPLDPKTELRKAMLGDIEITGWRDVLREFRVALVLLVLIPVRWLVPNSGEGQALRSLLMAWGQIVLERRGVLKRPSS